ncbi:MAG: SLC13 family permease [Phycisphaeraceae bacterium]
MPVVHPLVILLIGIALILGLIVWLRLNAFLALILAAMVVSLLAPGDVATKMARVGAELGNTAGGIGIIIALAAIIGKCMMDSGAADRIVRFFLRLLGEKRGDAALVSSGYVLSIPVFFDTVFYLLVPLARSMYKKTGKNYLLYVMAIAAGGACTHTLVPPTPGPLATADALRVDLGLMILMGAIIGIPASFAGVIYAHWLNKKMPIEMRPIGSGLPEPEPIEERHLPPLLLAFAPVLLPVLLIGANTAAVSIADAEHAARFTSGDVNWPLLRDTLVVQQRTQAPGDSVPPNVRPSDIDSRMPDARQVPSQQLLQRLSAATRDLLMKPGPAPANPWTAPPLVEFNDDEKATLLTGFNKLLNAADFYSAKTWRMMDVPLPPEFVLREDVYFYVIDNKGLAQLADTKQAGEKLVGLDQIRKTENDIATSIEILNSLDQGKLQVDDGTGVVQIPSGKLKFALETNRLSLARLQEALQNETAKARALNRAFQSLANADRNRLKSSEIERLNRLVLEATYGTDVIKPHAWETSARQAANFTGLIGNPNFALMLSAGIAIWLYVRQRKPTRAEFKHVIEDSLMSAGVIILITAAGGAFGAMLRQAEIGGAIQTLFAGDGGKASGMVLLFMAFGIASILKIAQGSSTVAMITTASMISAMIVGVDLPFNPVYLATAIASGSLIAAWMNDSGFWIYARMGGFSEVEALKSWTVMLVIMGLVGMLFTLILATVLPLTG